MIVLMDIMFFLFVGGAISFLVALALDFEYMRLISLIIFFSSGIFLIGYGIIDSNTTSEENTITWNEGYHSNCGGKWNFCQKDSGDYIYKCDKCHKIEIFKSLMNQNVSIVKKKCS